MFDKEILEKTNNNVKIYHGDSFKLLKKIPDNSVNMIISSPPYCMGKEYESLTDDEKSFIDKHKIILPEVVRILKKGGSLCWQIGYHVKNSEIIPLDILVYNIIMEFNSNFSKNEKMKLRNRIIWTFGHGLHSKKRLSGRHEIILWFTKGDEYTFNLDDIRIPQKYPGKTHHKGEKKGKISGNPNGKNPSDVWKELVEDVWDIPNVKFNHPEKTAHPCQFPSAIPIRLVKALTNVGDIVMDPFMGSGTSAIASIITDRNFIGGELNNNYFEITKQRILDAINGKIKLREDKPVYQPTGREKVAKKPECFK
jgi:bstYI methyltransferase